MNKIQVIYWAGFTICLAILILKRHWFLPKDQEKEIVKDMCREGEEFEKYALPFLVTMGCIFWPFLIAEKLYNLVVKCK